MAASLSRAVILLNRIVQSLQQSLAGEARRPWLAPFGQAMSPAADEL